MSPILGSVMADFVRGEAGRYLQICGNTACIVTIVGKQLRKRDNIVAAVAVVVTADLDKVADRFIEGVCVFWFGGRYDDGGHGSRDR